MKRLSFIAAALLCFVTAVSAAIRPAQPGIGGGGTTSGSITGAYTFNGPFSTVNATNVYLNAGISNLAVTGVSEFATNRTLVPSIFTNTVYVNARGANQAANGLLLTNALATAPAFCRIVVGPGDYFVAEVANPSPSFATDNRWIDFQPGANWRAGSTSGAAFFMFDDDLAKVTNVWVTGRGSFFQTNIAGGSGNLLYLGKGSTVYFEHQNAYLTNADSTFSVGGIGNNTLDWITHGKATTMTYDNAYFTMNATNKVRAFFNEIETVGDVFELGGDAANWGDVVVGYNSAKAINGLSGQSSIMQIGGRAIVKNGTLLVERTAASIYSTSATTNGMLEGGFITMPPNGARSVLQDNSAGTGAPFNGLTALWMKNLTVVCATNVDALTLTNGTSLETILENVTFVTGFASTNLIRAATPSRVRILGNLGMFPAKAIGANITIVGTNAVPALDNFGTLVQRGASTFSGDVEFTASMVTLKGATQLSAESEIFANSFFVTNLFYIPFLYNGAAVDGVGAILQRSNAWATGRGTIIFNDQTAEVGAVATLMSDTPSNGQVPTWNTGGTITWEASGSGTPGGSSAAVQFNQSGTFAGTNTFVYDRTNNTLTAGSFIGSGTGTPVLQLFATNNNAVVMGIANSNSVMITNLVGQLHKANAVYIELDCNHGNDFHITNRIAQNTIVNWLNPAQGQTLSLRLHGAVSGGTDYFVTNTFPTSWLVANQSSNSAPMAVQLPVSVLDGTGAELNIRPYRLFTGSTNIAGAIINTYTE